MMDKFPETTIDLLSKVRLGDTEARDRLVERSIPPLRRWARGRLPQWARGLTDTTDLVQDVVLRALPRLNSFDPKGPGALQAFLRRAAHNQIVDEMRRAQCRQVVDDVLDFQPDPAPSPLEQAITHEGLERYRSALARLSKSDQAIIHARIERQMGYDEIAAAFGKPTASAARMAVSRAIGKLVKAMASKRK